MHYAINYKIVIFCFVSNIQFCHIAYYISDMNLHINYSQKNKVLSKKSFNISIYFILVLICLIQSFKADATQEIINWTMRVKDKSYVAKVPANAIQNLIDNGALPSNFYYRDNFLKAYQYQVQDFIYDTTFLVSATNLNYTYHTINFEGLDTHCEVILNNQKILQSHNMYRRYEVDVKLKNINNLTIKFNSSANYDKLQQNKFFTQYGFNLPQNYSYTRKAAYQYGWDWGPRILSVGIWKPVIINFYQQSKFKTLEFNQLTPIDKDTQMVTTESRIILQKMDPKLKYLVEITIHDANLTKTLNSFSMNISGNSTYKISSVWNLTNSTQLNFADYAWWTWDLGKQNMIRITFAVTNIDKRIKYQKSIETGLRTVKLTQTQSFNGTSFTINLNGYDIYMRGGNYIPPQMSLARTNSSIYKKTIQNALKQNFNMIRVWGGGQFEKDQFYTECDKAGILIWHDLMFACALYPYNEQIGANIAAQMEDNLIRLKHHPSIGLWNGNNQIWIGWQEWGWKNNKTQAQKNIIQQMYASVFKNILPNTINKITPDIPYWETSPSVSSSYVDTIVSGDIHFWRVWGGGTPIQQYKQFVGRFNSQYGMQSMPDISTIQKFTNVDDRKTLDSEILRLHQRHPRGDEYLPMYVNNYTGTTKNLTRFSYLSQVMQAYALELAISSLRGSKPFNMGSLYWQLNDVWPVSSWATIDYYQVKKAAHYSIKKLYQPLLIMCYQPFAKNTSNSTYRINLINDYNKQYQSDVKISVHKFNGDLIYQQTIKNFTVTNFQNHLVSQLSKSKYNSIQKDIFIKVQANYTQQSKLNAKQSAVSTYQRNIFVPAKPKDRNVIDPKLKYSLNATERTLTVSSQNLATYVWIYGLKGTQASGFTHFQLSLQNEQNYLTLLPGQTKTIKVTQTGDLSQIKFGITSYQLQTLKQKSQQKLSKLKSLNLNQVLVKQQ